MLVDIDGTLTNDTGFLSKRTISAIQLASSNDFPIGVCTSRSYAISYESILSYFPIHAVHVMSGGSVVIKSDGEIVSEAFFPKLQLQQFVKEVEACGACCIISHKKTVYVTEKFIPEFTKKQRWSFSCRPLSTLEDVEVSMVTVGSVTPDAEIMIDAHQGFVKIAKTF